MKRIVVLAFVCLVSIWLAVCGLLVFRAYESAKVARAALDDVSGLSGVELVRSTEAESQLRVAASSLSDVHDAVTNPIMAPLSAVPWVGTQRKSAEKLSTAGALAAQTALEASERARELAENGTVDETTFAELRTICTTSERVIGSLDLGPESGLASPLATARSQAASEIENLRAVLADCITASRG